MDNLGSNVDALIVDVRLLTWNKTQRKVRFSRHWSVDRHLEALRGVPTGMAGTSQLFNSSACFLGFLLCIPLLLVQFGFSFPPFFFCWVVYCLGFFESYHWNICILHNDRQLVILQGQHWEMLDLPEVHADSQM